MGSKMKNINQMTDEEIVIDMRAPKITMDNDGNLLFPSWLSVEQKQEITRSYKDLLEGKLSEEISMDDIE